MAISDRKISLSRVMSANPIPRVHCNRHVPPELLPPSPHDTNSSHNRKPIKSQPEFLLQPRSDLSQHTTSHSQLTSMLTSSHPTSSTNPHTHRTQILIITSESQPLPQTILRPPTP